MPTRKDIQNLYFMDSRFKLLDIAAFLDRVERHEGPEDFRHAAFLEALEAMRNPPAGLTRAQAVHHAFSDHTTVPAEKASLQGANGAVDPATQV